MAIFLNFILQYEDGEVVGGFKANPPTLKFTLKTNFHQHLEKVIILTVIA